MKKIISKTYLPLVILSVLSYIYLFLKSNSPKYFGILSLAILAGIVLELLRLRQNWQKVIKTIAISYLLSLPLLIGYFLGSAEFFGPLWFIFFAGLNAIISIHKHKELFIIPLHKGMNLIEALALGYWIYAGSLLAQHHLVYIPLVTLAGIFIIISSIYILLKKHYRSITLMLSIGSSVLMLIFGSQYLIDIYDSTQAFLIGEHTLPILFAQYLVLGISIMYIMQNIKMILVYLPFYRKNSYDNYHMNEIDLISQDHIDRYQQKKITATQTLAAILSISLLFALNEYFTLIPYKSMIWFSFLISPLFFRK